MSTEGQLPAIGDGNTRRRWKPRHDRNQIALSLVAIFVSIGTLAALTYQTYMIRRQSEAAVMPSVFVMRAQGGGKYSFYAVNDGTGPAFIDAIYVEDHLGRHAVDPVGYMDSLQAEGWQTGQYMYSNYSAGRVLPAGAEVVFLDAQDTTARIAIDSAFGTVGRAVIGIEYSSAFGTRWDTRFGGVPTRR